MKAERRAAAAPTMTLTPAGDMPRPRAALDLLYELARRRARRLRGRAVCDNKPS